MVGLEKRGISEIAELTQKAKSEGLELLSKAGFSCAIWSSNKPHPC